jgi:hypothetical protein
MRKFLLMKNLKKILYLGAEIVIFKKSYIFTQILIYVSIFFIISTHPIFLLT